MYLLHWSLVLQFDRYCFEWVFFSLPLTSLFTVRLNVHHKTVLQILLTGPAMSLTGLSPQQRLNFIHPHGFICFQMSSYYSAVPWGNNNRDLFADFCWCCCSLPEFLSVFHRFSICFQIVREAFGHLNVAVVLTGSNFYLLHVICTCGFEVALPQPQGRSTTESCLQSLYSLHRAWSDFPVLPCLWLAERVIQSPWELRECDLVSPVQKSFCQPLISSLLFTTAAEHKPDFQGEGKNLNWKYAYLCESIVVPLKEQVSCKRAQWRAEVCSRALYFFLVCLALHWTHGFL